MARASKIDTEIASMHAKYIHKLLKQGGMRVLTDPETKRVEYIDFTAAILNAINNHLKRMNINSMAASTSGSAEEEAERRIKSGKLKFNGKAVGGKLPPLSEADDEAVTG